MNDIRHTLEVLQCYLGSRTSLLETSEYWQHNLRNRQIVRQKDRVKEYMHERVADKGGGIKQARRVYG